MEEDLPLDWTRLSTAIDCWSSPPPPPSSSTTSKRTHAPPPKRYPQDVVPSDTFSSTQTTYIEIVGTAGQKITEIGSTFHTLVNAKETSHLILRSHLIQSMKGIQYFPNLYLLELYDNHIEVLEELGPPDEEDETLKIQQNKKDDEDKGKDETDETQEQGDETLMKQSHTASISNIPIRNNQYNIIQSCTSWPGKSIHTLDLSYNSIRSMESIQYCVNLQVLYLANNKIKEMAGLKHLSQLRILDLGANRIRTMDCEQLSGLINLQQLWLGKNKITDVSGLDSLTQLRQLDIQCNRLIRVDQLQGVATSLEELYLADNAIDDVGLELGLTLLLFPKLTTLDVSRNQLTTCQCMSHLTSLTDLWLSGNQISSFENVESLRNLKSTLQSIYLEYNPIYEDFEYRMKLKVLLPHLEQIDAVRIDGGYGMTWTTTTAAATITTTTMTANTTNGEGNENTTRLCRESILKPTSMGGMKQLQDIIMERAEEETVKKKKSMISENGE